MMHDERNELLQALRGLSIDVQKQIPSELVSYSTDLALSIGFVALRQKIQVVQQIRNILRTSDAPPSDDRVDWRADD